jgi:hypothetical protein
LIPEQTARIIEELTSYYSFHMKTASQLEREEKIMLKESAQGLKRLRMNNKQING